MTNSLELELEQEFEREIEKKTPKSKELFERAKKVIPGGVHANLRYHAPYPFHVARAEGCKVYDVDGNVYDDYWIGHGALILGHCNPVIKKAVEEQLEKGWHFGLTHEKHIELAERIVGMVPHAEKVRFANTGTEANLFCIRLARAFTGRDYIAKFEGGWHGGYDPLNVKVHYPWDRPNPTGLTAGSLKDTITLPYNYLEGVQERIKGRERNIACIIVEPFLGAGGFIPAEKEFLQGLREITLKYGIVLIFDEVISGFRLAPGGAAEYYGVKPDISVFGKALSGGFPIGAIAGRADILDLMSPFTDGERRVAQGGTFCGNPLSMVAGIAELDQLKDGKYLKEAGELGNSVRRGLRDIIGDRAHVLGIHCATVVHFTDKVPKNAVEAATPRNTRKSKFLKMAFLTKNIYFVEGMRGYTVPVHSNAQINKLFEVTREFVKKGFFD